MDIGGKVNIRCRCGCKKLELIDKIPMSVFGHLRVKINCVLRTFFVNISEFHEFSCLNYFIYYKREKMYPCKFTGKNVQML